MQVSTLSAQLGHEPNLVDWNWDATCVSYGHSMVDSSPRTDDQLRFCTKTGRISSKFYIPNLLTRWKFLDDEHTKFSYSPSAPIIFPQVQKSFPSVLSKRVYQVPLRMYNKSSQSQPAKHKQTTRDKVSKRCSVVLSKKNHLEAKKRRSVIRKKVTTHKSHYSFLI